MQVKQAAGDWVVVVVWLAIFLFSAIAKLLKKKDGNTKPFDEVDWNSEDFKPANQGKPANQDRQANQARPGNQPRPGRPVLHQAPPPPPPIRPATMPAEDVPPQTLASQMADKARQREQATREANTQRQPDQVTRELAARQAAKSPAELSLEQMRAVVLAAAQQQQQAKAAEAPAPASGGYSAAIAAAPTKRAKREPWDRPKVDLRDHRRLRDALIAREVLERPRAYDI